MINLIKIKASWMFASLACNSLRRNKKTEASININMIVGPGGASPEVTRVTR